jgi:glutathione S-transferase
MPHAIDIYSFANLDRSARVRWACAEAGIAVREHRLDPQTGQHKGPEYRAINPFGIVPGVRMGDASHFDSVGILLNLVESQPKAAVLAVAVGHPLRARFLSWLMWSATSLDAASTALFFSWAFARDVVKQKDAMAKLMPILDDLEAQLAGRRYVMDGHFTIVDIVIGHALSLVDRAIGLDRHPGLRDYVARLAARPAAALAEVFTCKLAA